MLRQLPSLLQYQRRRRHIPRRCSSGHHRVRLRVRHRRTQRSRVRVIRRRHRIKRDRKSSPVPEVRPRHKPRPASLRVQRARQRHPEHNDGRRPPSPALRLTAHRWVSRRSDAVSSDRHPRPSESALPPAVSAAEPAAPCSSLGSRSPAAHPSAPSLHCRRPAAGPPAATLACSTAGYPAAPCRSKIVGHHRHHTFSAVTRRAQPRSARSMSKHQRPLAHPVAPLTRGPHSCPLAQCVASRRLPHNRRIHPELNLNHTRIATDVHHLPHKNRSRSLAQIRERRADTRVRNRDRGLLRDRDRGPQQPDQPT